MNTEEYRQSGWEKVSRMAEMASRSEDLRGTLRSKKTRESLVEFLTNPGEDYGDIKFSRQEISAVLEDIQGVGYLVSMIYPERYFWIALKLDEDFLDMK